MLRALCAAALTSMALAGAAMAGPLNPSHLPAGAAIVIHVDLEAATASRLGQYVLDNGDELDLEPLERVDEIGRETGLDPRKDIFDITVMLDEQEEPIIVATTSEAVDDALESARAELGDRYSTRRLGDHQVSVLGVDDEPVLVYVTSEGARRTVVAGKNADRVSEAIAVIAGDRPSLRDGDSPLAGAKPRKGAIIFVAISDASEIAKTTPASAVFRESLDLRAQLGEAGGRVFALASASVADEKAELVAQTATGLVALGTLIATSEDTDQAVRDARVSLLSALKFSATDAGVQMSFDYDADEFIKLLEDARARPGHK